MSEQELRRNRRMGANTMKITVVGAALILAGVVVGGLLVLFVLNQNKAMLMTQQNGSVRQDQPPSQGTTEA